MVKNKTWWGLLGIGLIVLLLGFNMLREPNRQVEETDEQETAAVDRATELYALNCVECHGASGEGLNLNPALNDPAVRAKDPEDLFRTIARGRPNTAMVAFSIEENGIFTTPQINDLVTFLYHARWRDVERYVDEHDLRPSELPPIEAQFDIENLSYPLEVVSEGRLIYLGNCFSCHNAGAAGVTAHRIGTDLSDNEFVRDHTDEELLEFIQDGRAENDPNNVTGYEMPARGGNPNLSDDEIMMAVAYVRELNNNTVIGELVAASDTTGTWNNVTYEWVEVTNNLDNPLLVTHAGDGSNRLFVIEQTGLIMIIENGELRDEPFMDVTGLLPEDMYHGSYTEQGLLGLAFHPDYAANGLFFISYINREGNSVIARYHISPDDPYRADPDSGVILLTVDQPFTDHNGGNIVFGPDGYLYIGFGDGGRPSEPNYNSQEPDRYLGKMLRVDVTDTDTYRVPDDNPFLDDSRFLPEIWALGLRNPWRFSFDRVTGDLYIGDVGQWRFEEVDFQPADSNGGENYGWSAYEASHLYLEDETVLGIHTPPILEYGHEAGLSITGGYVYRGSNLPGLDGMYIYGDYVNGIIWLATQDETGAWQSETFMDTGFVISSFGEDEQGELYLVDYKGSIYQLELAAEQPEQPEDAPES